MRGGFLKSWSGLAVLALLGACSNIIGVSSYEIDPALDESEGGAGSGGSKAGGGKGAILEAGAPGAGGGAEAGAGGSDVSTGGTPAGGSNATGGTSTDGGSPLGGDGMGGDPTPTGCGSAKDCDDTIDCTTDACGNDGVCTHTPDDTACSPLAGNCAVCKSGIGCVEAPGTVTELLLDPSFDLKTGDWVDYRDGLPASIVADASAHTPGNSVRLGPAPNNATEQGFTDLAQQVTIPQNAVSLVVSGYYKLTPGTVGAPTRDAVDDYTTLTLFSLADENDEYVRYVDYHEWYGDGAAQATWKAFTYTTSKTVLAKVLDQEVTLDLVTETWDTRFAFDSLSLKVTTCE